MSGELLTKRKGTYYVLSLRENKKMKNHELAMDVLIDLEEEKGKLEKEIKQCLGMLKNPGFVNKDPEAKVYAEKEKLVSYTEKLEMTKTQLDNILKKLG